MGDWGVSVHIIEPGVFNRTGLYNTYHEGTRKLWQQLPDQVKDDYGEAFKESLEGKLSDVLRQLGNKDSSLVPQAMVEALTSQKPRYRYQVGTDAKILLPLFGFLNEWWQDWIFRPKSTRKDVSPPAAMEADAYKAAEARYAASPGLRILFFLVAALLGVKLRS